LGWPPRDNDFCTDVFRQLRFPCLPLAVLTGLFHLVGDPRVEMAAAWKLVRSEALVLATIEDRGLPICAS
jgi:hypothetical protein